MSGAPSWLAGVWLLWMVPGLPVRAQQSAPDSGILTEEQESQAKEQAAIKEKKQPEAFRFVFRRYPSIRLGRWFRADFRAKFQLDFRHFEPDPGTAEGLADLHRVRVGVQGTFLRHFEYEVEREIRDVFRDLFEDEEVARATTNPWRDVYVNFRYFNDFQVRGGQFKLPFGMEQLTGPANLDFPFRALISSQLTPGRDMGIAMHGRFLRRGLNYEVGLFRGDGDNANIRFFEQVGDEAGPKQDIRTGLRTVAARLTGMPLRLLQVPAPLKGLELGGAFTTSAVPEGIKGLRGRSYSKNLIFRHIDVKGERLRLGTELRWMPGPFSLKSEFIHVRDQRKGQGITGNDLPDLISRGWYVSGTWVVTGQSHAQRDEPKKEFLLGRGLGAVELAGRYETMRFGSSAHPGRPSRTPRAANILGNSDRAWTFGVNWYWNRFIKVQLNGIRERIEDPERSPISGRQTFWIGLCRLQVVM